MSVTFLPVLVRLEPSYFQDLPINLHLSEKVHWLTTRLWLARNRLESFFFHKECFESVMPWGVFWGGGDAGFWTEAGD